MSSYRFGCYFSPGSCNRSSLYLVASSIKRKSVRDHTPAMGGKNLARTTYGRGSMAWSDYVQSHLPESMGKLSTDRQDLVTVLEVQIVAAVQRLARHNDAGQIDDQTAVDAPEFVGIEFRLQR